MIETTINTIVVHQNEHNNNHKNNNDDDDNDGNDTCRFHAHLTRVDAPG